MNTAICNKKPSTLVLLKAFLSGYLKFIESPHRQDTILKTLQYSLWLLSKFYRSSGKKRDIPHRIAKSLLSLQDEVSWARYLYRFFGFPAAINDVYQTRNDWGKGSKSKRLGQVMAWTMVAYYPLDHLSYLLWKAPEIHWVPLTAPIRMKDGTSRCPNRDHGESSNGYSNQSSQLASKASAWSCRFWLIWLFLDTFRCTLALRDTEQSPERLKTLETAPGANNELEQTEVLGKGVTLQPCTNETPTVRTEHLQIIRNLTVCSTSNSLVVSELGSHPGLFSDRGTGGFG
eukprot:jgi/Psemu1/298031/fgenesh1_pm.448_\